MSLTARYLEANGIPTVIMGCAKDIVEHAGVPRFLFSDFPLGNAGGKPHDPESQRQTLALALDLLESATGPRTTLQNPQHWNDDAEWKLDFRIEYAPTTVTRDRGVLAAARGSVEDGLIILVNEHMNGFAFDLHGLDPLEGKTLTVLDHWERPVVKDGAIRFGLRGHGVAVMRWQ